MLGFLLDEDEFEVSPAISRGLILTEMDVSKKKRKVEVVPDVEKTKIKFQFPLDIDSYTETFTYGTDLVVSNTKYVDSYDVYLNDIYFGSNITFIPISVGDVLKVDIVREAQDKSSNIIFESNLTNSNLND